MLQGGDTTHIHDGDAGGVEAVDGVDRGHADGADEEPALLIDHDVHELIQAAAGVILTNRRDCVCVCVRACVCVCVTEMMTTMTKTSYTTRPQTSRRN